MAPHNKRLQWFITYPRTALTRDEFLKTLSDRFKPTEIYVAQETHEEKKEGMPDTHLHCAMKLPFDKGVNKKTLLDFLQKEYGEYEMNRINVKGIPNWKKDKDRVLNYMAKEDENPLSQVKQQECEELPNPIDWKEYIAQELELRLCQLKDKYVKPYFNKPCTPSNHHTECTCDEWAHVMDILDTFSYRDSTDCSIENDFRKFLEQKGFIKFL